MKKAACFAAAILVLAALVPASGDGLTDILYKNVRVPDVSRAGMLAEAFTSLLGEPETVPPSSVKLKITIPYREYVAISVDAEDNMKLVICSASTAYCWTADTAIHRAIAKRAFQENLPCYYLDEPAGVAVWSDMMKFGPSGDLGTFGEFLEAVDRLQMEKAGKLLGDNTGDRFFALFSKAAFGDSPESVIGKYGRPDGESADDPSVLTYTDRALFRTLSEGMEKYTEYIRFSFEKGQLETCSLLAGGSAGNFTFCRAYLSGFYGEPYRTDADSPGRKTEGGNAYAWQTDGMLICITETGDGMTQVSYRRAP